MTLVTAALRPVKKFVGKQLAHFFNNEVSYDNGLKLVAPPHVTGLQYLSLIRGRHEEAELGILREHFKSADTIIEVGANIGVVSCHALALKVNPGGRLICVEPNPHAIPTLQTNLDRTLANPMTARDVTVELVQAALTAPAHGDQAEFFARNNLSSGLTSHVARTPRDHGTVTVDLISLSEILYEHDVDGPYSLICDAEGAEIPMIFEDSEALKGCTQMAIELHEPKLTGINITREEMLDRLEHQGFVCEGHSLHTYYLHRAP